jgi:hypothetical protein
MTSHPLPSQFVRLCQTIEHFPQVPIAHRVPIACQPTVCFPAWQLLQHSALDILRVGNHAYRTRFFEVPEALNGSFRLHPVVSGPG